MFTNVYLQLFKYLFFAPNTLFDGLLSESDEVSTLKFRKAPGIDGIQAEHLKYGGRTAILYLCKLFNGIFKIGIIPKEWKKKVLLYPYTKGIVRSRALPTFTDPYHYYRAF